MKRLGWIFFIMMLCTNIMVQALPSLAISQYPLLIVTPSHPQILIALANSQSMDGNLSGAIMTGSGQLPTGSSTLLGSSSPVNYAVPAGFTPPIQGADVLGNAPYTVIQSGIKVDNSASRMNVAKAGIQSIISAYINTVDFALETYNVSGISSNNTWVYYISPTGANFSFTNLPNTGQRVVSNPCFGYLAASTTVKSNCTSMAGLYGSVTLNTNPYMIIGNSSDDPDINDVLYTPSSSFPSVFAVYNGPTPASPYPPNFSVSNYNNGSILLRYSTTLPSIGQLFLSPTNAGFVPFTPQVIFARRGFGFYGTQSATQGSVVVPMTTVGSNPTSTQINNAINLFTPYLNPETSSASTSDIKSSAAQAPMAGLLTTAQTYLSSLSNTDPNGCPQKKYVVFISDGLPTEDLSGKLWPPLGSASATGYGVTATFNADGSLNTTNSQALQDAINTITNLRNAGIKTYVIGLGAGVDASLNPSAANTLTAMAVAGGTVGFYPATSPAALTNALNSVILSIQSGNAAASASSVNTSKISTNSIAYQSSFIAADLPYLDWTSNVFAVTIDPTTGQPTSNVLWSAQTQLDSLVTGTGWSSSRKILTFNNTTNLGVPFTWASISASQKLLLEPSDTLGTSRVDYLRGNTALEKRNGGAFRNRSHILGDIVDSQATYVAEPTGLYFSSSYQSFQQTQQSRQPMLYVGANDGMMHAFNAINGQEVFAFIPNAVIPNLYYLTQPTYNQNHLFYVNATPQVGDVQFSDSTWRTLLVGGEGAGGNSIYAIDVTNPNTFTSEANIKTSILWEYSDTDLGLTYSQPQLAQIGLANANPGNFAVFFGNGYNSTNNHSVLYALNPQTGSLIRKMDFCTLVAGSCDANAPQGLSTVAVANIDGLQGQPVQRVYAGDLQGNLWSVDVSSTDPNAWTVRLLFQARDANGNKQPITTEPVVSLHPQYPRQYGLFVMFGTGQLLTMSDLVDASTQTIYGVWDKVTSTSTYVRSNLQAQTLTNVSVNLGSITSIITATANALNWLSTLGWYADLPTAGQRVVTTPNLLFGSFVTALNTPPLASCNGIFSSMLLELNYATGGAFLRPQLDINGDGSINSSDSYNGSYPVGVSVNGGFSSAPTILGPNQNNNMVKIMNQSNGSQSTFINPNNNPGKIGWWQLQ